MIDVPDAGDAELDIGGRTVQLTTLERVLFPAAGLTKAHVARYYLRVAEGLLPHLGERPCTLARFPEGVDGYGWYQTQCRGPEWMRRVRIGTQDYCILDDLASLLWAANAGALELHPLLSYAARPDEPSAVVFDLDPGPPATVVDCCRVAMRLRELLGRLDACAKTSGSLGLHVFVPLAPGHTFEQTKTFARAVAAELAIADPNVLDRSTRALRRGRVLVDWGQNDAAKSLPAPYSLRAFAHPTVSLPLRWQEVEAAVDAGHLVFGPADAIQRLERNGDLFAPVLTGAQHL